MRGGVGGAECLYIQIKLKKKPHPSFNSFPLTSCMTFLIHQKVWGNISPLSEDSVIKSGGWLSRCIVSGKPVRPSSVINALTSFQPDSLHQALFIWNFRTSWSYPRLIPVEAAVKHLSTISMDSNNFTSAQPDGALAHVCAMCFCLPALGFLYGSMDYTLWLHLWIPEIVGIHDWGANVWSMGDETHMDKFFLLYPPGWSINVQSRYGFGGTIECDPSTSWGSRFITYPHIASCFISQFSFS